jgi:hypothetical protein
MRSKADVGNVESTYQLIAGHLRRSAASSERLISDPLGGKQVVMLTQFAADAINRAAMLHSRRA